MKKSNRGASYAGSIVSTEKFIGQISAAISLVISVAVSFLIIKSFKPVDLSAYSDLLLPKTLEDCLPENDLFAYAAFVVLFPTLHTVLIHLFRKLFSGSVMLSGGVLNVFDFLWSCAVSAVAIAFVAVFYLHPYYADRYLYGKDKILLVVAGMIFAFIMSFAYKMGKLKTANEIASLVLGAAFLVFVLYAAGKHNYMNSYSGYNLHHYSAWWNPIYKVGSGLTLGDGFNELYGFYPYLIVPILKLFGGVNQKSLSLYMALIFTLMAFCLLFFCRRFFKNRLLGTFCATGFFAIGPMIRYCNAELYYQYYPTRALFIFLVMGLIALYCSVKKHHNLLMIAGAAICALGLVWNLESGLVATIIWAGFLIFEKAVDHRLNEKALLSRIGFAVLSSVISVVLFVLIVETITYVRAGMLLGINDILFGILTFSAVGFYMLPLEPGIWFAVAAALIYGLYATVPHLAFARKKDEELSVDRDSLTGLFMATVAGIGSFMYFMGRSFPTNCMTFMPWIIMICSFLADSNIGEAVDIVRARKEKKNVSFMKMTGTGMRLIACFLVVGIAISSSVVMVGNAFDKDAKTNSRFATPQPAFSSIAAQISEWTGTECGGVVPYIFHEYAAFIQEHMGIPTRENVYEQINWFYYSDVHTYIEFINAHPGVPFVIDDYGRACLDYYFEDEWAEIASRYELRATASEQIYVPEDIMSEYSLYVPIGFSQ